MPERYDPSSFEAKWQQRWKEADLFKTTEDPSKPKFYGLDFFPYPSGAGLSVGHCRNYIPTDVLCRLKRMQGYNVLHPMGFDAFGLPAENEAIKTKTHPAPMIERYAATYRRQMDLVGISYDWSRSFASCEPSYYRWTQWIFKLLYERGLAYRKLAAVNWDPIDKTVLADEEIVGGRAERSGALVEKRWIPQWYFKITEYAQRLIDDLEDIDWPDGIKTQQRNWIGRSEGVQFQMDISFDHPTETPLTFEAFTTRIDTIFGVTFCVLSPEHPLMDQIKARVGSDHASSITAYQEAAKLISDTDRQATNREKTGVFTGAYAINPVNGEKVQLWVADYVLATYGTGAIMAVPGHDERDFEFAMKFGIPVVQVVGPLDNSPVELPYIAKEGKLVNSGDFSNMSFADAQAKLGEWFESKELGQRKIQYKLRDWLISRQRYWGCPIPILHHEDGSMSLVPDEQLPVTLPDVEHYEPAGDGSSPLAHIDAFVNTVGPDGKSARRETDTMGGFACSSWYFLRFCDPKNEEQGWDPEKIGYWMPVDCYVGGAEHAVMHLLYARFWTKVLYDAGLVKVKEPFMRLQNQGQVLGYTPYRKPRTEEKLDIGEEGILISYKEAEGIPKNDLIWKWARMSKSKGNVVTPDDAVAEFGADALRVYELFVAPFDADIQWSNDGMQGAVRFLNRVIKLANDFLARYHSDWASRIDQAAMDEAGKKLRRLTHQSIAKVTADIDRFGFNTYISQMMIFVNESNEVLKGTSGEAFDLACSEALESLILLMAPAAPHTADELWEGLGKEGFTFTATWPVARPELAAEDSVTVAVQVNGKLRDTFDMPAGSTNEALEQAAMASAKVQANLEGKTIRKVIVVAGKLVNIVAN